MEYKLICKENSYPDLYFQSLKEARVWLYEHGRNQLTIQHDLREPKDVGHDISLTSTCTYGLADYFDFELIKTNRHGRQ